MADAYMGWDVGYCTRLLPLLEPFRLRWIEEPVSPDDVEGYARVKELANARGILVAGGEHEYTRYGMRRLIERRAVDVLQPDVNRVGGISEAQQVWALRDALPLLLLCNQSFATFVGTQKEWLYRAGLIASPRLRAPAAALAGGVYADFAAVLEEARR